MIVIAMQNSQQKARSALIQENKVRRPVRVESALYESNNYHLKLMQNCMTIKS